MLLCCYAANTSAAHYKHSNNNNDRVILLAEPPSAAVTLLNNQTLLQFNATSWLKTNSSKSTSSATLANSIKRHNNKNGVVTVYNRNSNSNKNEVIFPTNNAITSIIDQHSILSSATAATPAVYSTSTVYSTTTATTSIFNVSASTSAASTSFNDTSFDDNEVPEIPSYIRTTAMFFCIIIMLMGVIGNVMVPIVIVRTKDMRNSTNIFLTNLSIADLLVLLICTPTVLVELNTKPETWVLGHEMCKAVPFVELTVAHASVLTILAISFERYYAICEPLKAGYVCTKTRAILICSLAWGIAALFTSPILWVAEYRFVDYIDGSSVAVCLTQALNNWTIGFFMMTITLFFILPLFILIILYGIIAKNLISNKGPMMRIRPIKPEYSLKARKQVVLMLGAVVLSFFLCLLPFRLFTMYIILSSEQTLLDIGVERYYNLLYFCRIMLYLNSAVNPILYNLMSTNFRKGFYKLIVTSWTCGRYAAGRKRLGTNVVATTTTTSSNTNTTTTTSSSILSRSSNRRSSDEVCQRTRVQIQLQMPFGPDCEMVAMLHSNNTDVRAAAVVAASLPGHRQHHQQQYGVNGKISIHPVQHQRQQQHSRAQHVVCSRFKTKQISFEEEAAMS